jgi:hypothetical protein
MASSSYKKWLTDVERADVLTTLESADEYSDFSDLQSEGHNSSDSDENGGANTDQPTTNLRKRSRPAAPLFQWQSGVFTPNVHGFDDSDTGISPAIILPDQPMALDIFLLFFPAEIM